MIEERMKQILAEKQRLAQEEAELRNLAAEELERINAQIQELEQRKEQLEEFLGIEDVQQRAAHGQIMQLCLRTIGESGGGLTSSEVKERIEQENIGMKLTSVPATLSRMMNNGRLRRDESGRYYII